MNRRVIALTVVGVYVVGIGAGTVLERTSGGRGDDPVEGLSFFATFGLFAVLGAVLLARRPGHAMGPLFVAVGLLPAIGHPSEVYAASQVIAGQPVALWVRLMAWTNTWYWYVLLAILLVYVPLLFPDGRPPSPRWRWLAWLAGAGVAGACAVTAVSERILLQTLGPEGQRLSIDNPFGISGMPYGEDHWLFGWLGPIFLISALGAVAAVVVRFRRSRGVERQQLKWFSWAACLAVVSFVPDVVPVRLPPGVVGVLDVLSLIGFTGVPVAITLAILRYRLYEIDRLISRTVTYAVVSVLLVCVYAAVAVVPAAVFDARSDLLVACATLAAAAVFVPVRRRVQGLVDRRFNRSRYDAQRVVERFGARLRGELNPDALAGDLGGVVASTVQPERVSIWLRDAGVQR